MNRIAALLAAFAVTTVHAEPRVEVFSPQGESKQVRQASARFSEPMVDFGDPRLADPFTVQCQGDAERTKGKGRWADATNWAWDFEQDLPAGQRCKFTLKPGIKTSEGAAVGGKREFEFNTGGPAVIASLPREGHTSIDEQQSFVLVFDGPVDPTTLGNLWCEAKGVNERIPAAILSEKETQDILAANKQQAYRYYRLWYKGPRPIPIASFKIDDKRFKDMPIVGAKCSRKLPHGAEVAVVVGDGVKTKTGIPRGVAQRLAFKVRPAFTLAFRCQRVNKDANCLPATPMTLSFNAPVPRELAASIRLKSGARAQTPKVTPNVNVVDYIQFDPPFAENAVFALDLPKNFVDDSGRAPSNLASFPLAVKTDAYPPLVKFPGRFGILEAADPTLPVTVRGIEPDMKGQQVAVTAPAPAEPIPGKAARVVGDEEAILRRYMEFMQATEIEPFKGRKDAQRGDQSAIVASDGAAPVALPRPAPGRQLEVIGIPLKKPGFYIVEFESPRLGAALHGVPDKPYFVSTSALVTNLAVHLKHGRESSLVWVTSLADGKPVRDAKVTVRDCSGKLHFEGKTDADGVATAGRLPPARSWPPCPLVAFARVGDDLSFTFSSWREGIEPWNYGMNTGYWTQRALSIHTVFDRTLFRAGDTVHMKHIARVPEGKGFRLPAANQYPKTVTVWHTGTDQKIELKVEFDANGVAESTWQIPKEAKLGQYALAWDYKGTLNADAQFRVEAFRVPLMRATLAAPKGPLIRPTSTKVDAAVTYLAGGPASSLPVKVRHRVEPRHVSYGDYPEFQFGGDDVKEGVRTGGADEHAYAYDEETGEYYGPEEASASGPVATSSYTLDAAGTAALTFDKLPPSDKPTSLVVEMEYSDPNGELLASSTRVPLHPAGLYVGIKPDGWAATRAGVNAQVIVLDTAGKPAANRAVKVDIYERQTYSSRRRVLGGFYAYDSTTETKRLGTGCSGTTDARGLVFCKVAPGRSGELILVARAADDAKRNAVAVASVWVVGEEGWWFDPSNHDRMDLVAEKRRYEPGETAKFQVRMPFREASVLVTAEREGVLSHKVVTLDAKEPVIEVPMLGHYGPNVYISALAVRGRVAAPKPTGLVDLGRPSYKLGVADVQVGRRAYELKVKVTPEREVFRVREKAKVAIEVRDADGKPAANGEIAVAAVDEGLLELMDNGSWKILDGLLGHRPVEVTTATAQGHVIGKRHFGRKAVPAGGGGGREGARELFDTLLYWKGRIALDAQGRANVEIPLNDSLTGFRIVAVSTQGAAKFGHGQATIRTTQDLMLFSGLPPVMREQDDFTAMFTLRNTTAAAFESTLSWAVYDRAADDKARKRVAGGEERVALAANESKVVPIPLKVPVDLRKLHWEVTATGGRDGKDTLRVAQDVTPVHPVRVYQATLARIDRQTIFYVNRPADAIPGRGSIRVELMGTLVGDMVAVREWFQYYPYTCLEQRASKAIGLRADALWQSVANSIPNYLDRDGLARYFPSETLEGSDALTAYVVQIAEADKREIDPMTLGRMLDGLEAFATGKITRGSALPTADLTLRKLAAIEALSRHDRARPEMLDAIAIDPARWPTSAVIDWLGILKRVPGIKDGKNRTEQAHSILRSRINFQGTVMTFSTEKSDALWWLMVTTDVNANRALLAVLEDPAWKADVGRLVRGALSRQVRGTWSTTVANAWGTVAMERYAEAFEKVPAKGTTVVQFTHSDQKMEVGEDRVMRDFAWPTERERLSFEHKGEGAPWVIVQSRAAIPLKEPLTTGYRIKRTVTPVEQKAAGSYARGDTYRVTLEIDAQADMTWVVVDDPIPSGATILGSGLGKDSAMLTRGERNTGWVWPAYIERTFSAYRGYYEFVPKGKFTVEYTVRLNNAGRFDLPSTRVEAMYAPEMLGEVPNASVVVAP